MNNVDTEYELALAEERLILEATELIEELLEDQGINRKELADRLGKSKGHVSQLLSGERNLTLKTLASLAHVLNHRLHLAAQPNAEPVSDWYRRDRRRSDEQPYSAGTTAPSTILWTTSEAWTVLSSDVMGDLAGGESKPHRDLVCARSHPTQHAGALANDGWLNARTLRAPNYGGDPELCSS